MNLYEKLLDLAQMLGEYHGFWHKDGMAGNKSIWEEIQTNYTKEEVDEATKIMYKQLSWSQMDI